MSESIDWEYRCEPLEEIRDVREYLHRRFKEGWRLCAIEGRTLRLRRRVVKLQAA